MNREVKVIIPNMREFKTFYSDNEGVIPMFFKRDWVAVKEEHWKPSEEQMKALRHKLNSGPMGAIDENIQQLIDDLEKL